MVEPQDPNSVDSYLAELKARREAVKPPPALMEGRRRLPRVSRDMYNDHPLMRLVREHLEHPPEREKGKRRHYTARTMEDYLGVTRLGLAAGDLLLPLQTARTVGRYDNVHKVHMIIDDVVKRYRQERPGANPDVAFGVRVSDLLLRAKEVVPPTTRSAPQPKMSSEEWEAFAGEAMRRLSSPYGEALLVLFTGGLRINDLFMLTHQIVQDASEGRQVVIYQKGEWQRLWKAPKVVHQALARLARTGTWQTVRDLFAAAQPGMSDHDVYNRAYAHVRRLINELAEGIHVAPYSPHKFRHTFAVRSRKSGGSLDVTQQLLGHKSISTTKIYVPEAPPEEIQAAVDGASPESLLNRRTPK